MPQGPDTRDGRSSRVKIVSQVTAHPVVAGLLLLVASGGLGGLLWSTSSRNTGEIAVDDQSRPSNTSTSARSTGEIAVDDLSRGVELSQPSPFELTRWMKSFETDLEAKEAWKVQYAGKEIVWRGVVSDIDRFGKDTFTLRIDTTSVSVSVSVSEDDAKRVRPGARVTYRGILLDGMLSRDDFSVDQTKLISVEPKGSFAEVSDAVPETERENRSASELVQWFRSHNDSYEAWLAAKGLAGRRMTSRGVVLSSGLAASGRRLVCMPLVCAYFEHGEQHGLRVDAGGIVTLSGRIILVDKDGVTLDGEDLRLDPEPPEPGPIDGIAPDNIQTRDYLKYYGSRFAWKGQLSKANGTDLVFKTFVAECESSSIERESANLVAGVHVAVTGRLMSLERPYLRGCVIDRVEMPTPTPLQPGSLLSLGETLGDSGVVWMLDGDRFLDKFVRWEGVVTYSSDDGRWFCSDIFCARLRVPRVLQVNKHIIAEGWIEAMSAKHVVLRDAGIPMD